MKYTRRGFNSALQQCRVDYAKDVKECRGDCMALTFKSTFFPIQSFVLPETHTVEDAVNEVFENA